MFTNLNFFPLVNLEMANMRELKAMVGFVDADVITNSGGGYVPLENFNEHGSLGDTGTNICICTSHTAFKPCFFFPNMANPLLICLARSMEGRVGWYEAMTDKASTKHTQRHPGSSGYRSDGDYHSSQRFGQDRSDRNKDRDKGSMRGLTPNRCL